jgi:hypothetical protein
VAVSTVTSSGAAVNISVFTPTVGGVSNGLYVVYTRQGEDATRIVKPGTSVTIDSSITISTSGNQATIDINNILHLQFGGNWGGINAGATTLVTSVDRDYFFDSVSGLFGTYTDDVSDDFMGPHGKEMSDAFQFGMSCVADYEFFPVHHQLHIRRLLRGQQLFCLQTISRRPRSIGLPQGSGSVQSVLLCEGASRVVRAVHG